MHPSIYAIDIETIPVKPLEEYDIIIQEYINSRIQKLKERDPEFRYSKFASLHGDFCKIVCISIGFIHISNEIPTIRLNSFYGEKEYELLTEFNSFITDFSGKWLHYNGLSFDIPVILQRFSHNGIKLSNSRFGDINRYYTQTHYDLKEIYYNYNSQNALSMGILSLLHNLVNPKEILGGDQVFQAYQNNDFNLIKKYCESDVITTINLYRKIITIEPAIPINNCVFSVDK